MSRNSSRTTSPLEKLANLLEESKDNGTLRIAAQKICDIARQHPQQLPAVFRQVLQALFSQTWEARIFAGEALGLIAIAVPHHAPEDLAAVLHIDEDAEKALRPDGELISLSRFCLDHVAEKGSSLLTISAPRNFQANKSPKNQSIAVSQDLGLAEPTATSDKSSMRVPAGKVSEGGVASEQKSHCTEASEWRRGNAGVEDRSANQESHVRPQQRTQGIEADSQEAGSSYHRTETAETYARSKKAGEADEAEEDRIAGGAWPFELVADTLLAALLDPAWHVRHGAAVGLREILRHHAQCAAVRAPVASPLSGWRASGGQGPLQLASFSTAEVQAAFKDRREWLDRAVGLLISLIVLDDFADYVADQITAPVRETAAQALALASTALPLDQRLQLLNTLVSLQASDAWKVRYGAMLGIKYLLATSASDAPTFLPIAMPALMAALREGEDDVQVVAAHACVPAVGAIASLGPPVATTLTQCLWDMLPDLSDISAATSSVLQLLGALHSYAATESVTSSSGSTNDAQRCLSLLWPFFDHAFSEVQVEACRCCCVLCSIIFQASVGAPTKEEEEAPTKKATDPLLSQTARHLLHVSYQKLLTTPHPHVVDAATDLATFVIEHCPVTTLGAALDAQLIHTLSGLPCMPLGQALAREYLFVPDLSGTSVGKRSCSSGSCVFIGGGEDVCVAGLKIRCARILARALELCTASQEHPTCLLAATNMRNMMGTFLQHPSVTVQTFAAMVYLFWLLQNKEPGQSGLDTVRELLFGALEQVACVQIQELTALQSDMIAKLAALLNALVEAQTPAALPPGFCLESIDATYATTILSAVASAVPGDERHPVFVAHAAAAKSIERLTEEAVSLRNLLCTVIAAACAACRELPDRVTALVQPLMGGLQRIADAQLLLEVVAPAIAQLMLACAHRTPSPNRKILHHLMTLAFSTPSDPTAEVASQPNTTSTAASTFASGEHSAASGAASVLNCLAQRVGGLLDARLPQLWDLIVLPPVAFLAATDQPSAEQNRAMLGSANLLRCIAVDLHATVHERLKPLLPTLIECMERASENSEIVLVATALAALAAAQPSVHLEFLVSITSAYMESDEPAAHRIAAVGLLGALLDSVSNTLLPYLLLLSTPALACMADPLPRVRVPAAQAFGRLVAMMPLAPLGALPPTPTLSETLRAKRQADADFLQQLLSSSRITPYEPPVKPKNVQLRRYQCDGISWLAFLHRFGLHGILADDMGLGKTIQSLTIIAAAMHDMGSSLKAAPSLIVCPASLVGHWVAEACQYFGHCGVRPIAMQGSVAQRAALQEQVAASGEPGRVLVVTSYDAVRSSITWLSQTNFEYCILDEGHIIRNPKAKVSQACKQIMARHRLILSGTPIQNSAWELWALFDFLMPGLLGTEAAFQRRFKATAPPSMGASRRAGAKDQEALMRALEELHQQVLPFILRRSKDQVLQDLPPKLMQDIVCDLSPLQRTLYDGVMAVQNGGQFWKSQNESFELLLLLRKLCSHPCLAISWDNEEQVEAARTALPHCSSTIALQEALPCLAQSPKLQALQQLLTDCGIIKAEPGDGDAALASAAAEADSGHRVLIFAQLRATLDLVESTVLVPAGLPFVRLDGAVKPKDRQEVVQRFNSDPTIPVMLLTTAVGSLGLNLTSADTVVFLEHDWNPMKDMQAMDRAHRLGQKRVVSVYRLLMRGTLEERIMSLQHFKKEVANSVVNTENVALESMEAEGLLDIVGASAVTAGGGGLPSSQLTKQSGLIAQQHEVAGVSDQYEDISMAAFVKRYQSSLVTKPT
jgi:TATA-binding protein-associated factor